MTRASNLFIYFFFKSHETNEMHQNLTELKLNLTDWFPKVA